jgi:hypothetical protein
MITIEVWWAIVITLEILLTNEAGTTTGLDQLVGTIIEAGTLMIDDGGMITT